MKLMTLFSKDAETTGRSRLSGISPFVICMLTLFVSIGQLSAQKTDLPIADLSVCDAYQTVRLQVLSGDVKQTDGQLRIALPIGFQLAIPSDHSMTVQGKFTSMATGTPVVEAALTGLMPTGPPEARLVTVTLPDLEETTTGQSPNFLEIEFKVQALCEAINTSGDVASIAYTLTNNTGTFTTESEALNVTFGVLHVSVAPVGLSGIRGKGITRTITITNNGNGPVTTFKLERTLGAGLSVVSTEADVTGSPWTEESEGVYVYTGTPLANGEKVTFEETVRIEECEGLTTNYKAYYGCEGECEVGTGLGQSDIILDTSIKPILQIIDTNPTEKLTCLGGAEFVKIYEIKNTGTGTAQNIKFVIGTENQNAAGYGATYFEGFGLSETQNGTFAPVQPTILESWSPDRGAVYSTTGKTTRVELTIEEPLASGKSVYIRVVQKNHAPIAQGDCTELESSVRFGNTYFEGTYKHDKACSDTDIITFNKVNLSPSNTFSFDGINMGGQEVFGGIAYQADFVLSDLSVSHHGLQPGAHLDLIVELSSNLTVSPDGVRLFNEKGKVVGTAFPSVGNTYVFSFTSANGTAINLSSYRLLFDANIDCDNSTDTYYRIKPVLYPKPDCNIALKCYEQKLTNKCNSGDCANGGFINGPVSLKRVNYGQKEQDPDAPNNTGTPVLPLTTVNPDDFPLLRKTAFTTNDKLEISQTNTVRLTGTSPSTAWTTGKMVVKLTEGENLDFTPVANSGKVVIIRGNTKMTITGLPVTKDTGLGVGLFEFNTEDLSGANVSGDLVGFSGFINNDIVTLSFQTEAKQSGNNGLREFSVESAFTVGGIEYGCGGASHASGYYAKGTLAYKGGGTGNISSCDNNSPVAVTLDYTLLNNHRNALFPFEFRQFVSPKVAVFNVSAGLEMTGVKLVLINQSDDPQEKIISLSTPVVGGSVNFDLNEGLKELHGGAYTQGYLNEGFVLEIYPIVKTLCEAGTQETVGVQVLLNGTVQYDSQNYYDEDITTSDQTLYYNTGADALRVSAPAAPQTVTDKIQWIVQVQNRSSFRNLKNVWLSKTAGPIGISSIQKVASASDWNAVGQPLAESNGFYELGDLNHGASSYYLVTAPIPTTTCESSSLTLVYGESCQGYPTSLGDACSRGSAKLDLVYTPRYANVQSRVVDQISSIERPEICKEFPYTIELNNAGDGAAKEIKVKVPFVNGDPLTYKVGSFAVTAAFQGSTVPAYTIIDDAQVDATLTAQGIIFTIPASALPATDGTLPAGYKMNVQFALHANGCEFRSGQRIAFNIDALNICGSVAKHSNSTSNRITVKGAENIDAELVIEQADAAIVATTAPGNVIRAKYSFEFSNNDDIVALIGTDGEDTANGLYPHKFSIKLPANWAFEKNLTDLFAATVATFESTDPEKGHVFVLKSNVPKNGKISLLDETIKFTGNIADFRCDEIKEIKESVFGKFKPEDCPDFNCEMEQVLLEHVTPMSLAVPVITAENQVFCVTDQAKLKDLVVTGDNLRFYDQAEGGNQLDANTLLGPVAGANPSANNLYTYYVSASVLATACETPRIPVRVYIPVANAGADQSRVNGKEFTLNGNVYQAPAKGHWTIITISGAQISEVILSDADVRNPKVTMPIGAEVLLRWTLTDGSCSTSDEVLLRSLINPIVADDNSYTVTNSKTGTGSTPLESVLKNDKLGNAEATTGNITLTPGTPSHDGLTMNPDGSITVAPGTPAGIYTYPYRICEKANPTNCDDAIAKITIVPPVIDAIDDDYTGTAINGMTGGKTPTVLENDLLDGVPVIPSEIKLTPGTPSHSGLTMNPDGTITVAPGTPEGTYTYTYKICEVLNPNNCDNATATVKVTAAPIDAINDTFGPVTSTSGSPNVGNALTNDKLNGLPATLDKVEVKIVTPATPVNGAPVPVLDRNTGVVSVPKGTPAKDYTIVYEICEVLNPANCDEAHITVTVIAPPLHANNDTYGPVRGDQGNSNLGNVLLNDVIDGRLVIKEDIILTVTKGANPINPGAKVPVIDANGQVSVPAGTPDGTYTIEYSICDKINPTTNCSPATVTVTVGEATIDAIDDIYAPVNGKVGGKTSSVLGNDLINGTVVTLGTDITLTPGTSPHGGLTMNADGTITVAPGTPASTYQYPYTICSVLNPTDCDQAIATVIVTAAPIDAVDDNYSHEPVNGKVGTTTPLSSVLGNDLLNNVAVDLLETTFTPGTSPLPGKITMDANNGTIEVAAGTPAGTYIYTYRICEVLNPTNCDNAIATIVVSASPIQAKEDNYGPINGKKGTTNPLPSVLENDLLNGVKVVPSEVKLTPGTRPHPGIILAADGTITVAPGTPAGNYVYPYTICEVLNPTNCSQTVANINVVAATIDAIDNDYTGTPINGMSGGKTTSVLDNDKLNDITVVPSEVILIPGTSGHSGLTMNSDGTITVAPGTPEGTYTYTYKICELLNPTNCDNATATVKVIVAPIDAVNDTFGPVTSTSGSPNVGNALTNDKLNGLPATLDKVEVKIVNPATPVNGAPVPVLDLNTGIVSVPKGTPAGDYTIKYKICEVLNLNNCDEADITVSVIAPPLQANNDTYGPVSGKLGNSNLGNVLLNDIIDGRTVILNDIVLKVTKPATPVNPGANVPVIDVNGQVSVPAGTPDGPYTIEYSICDKINPSNCKTATVTVTVGEATIDAIDDIYAPINGKVGGKTTSVLGNDLINGTVVELGKDVTLTPGASPLSGKLTMNTDGTITVSAGTPAGTYQYPYTICSVLNPTDCDQAIATVIVTAAPIDAVDDNYSHEPVNGKVGTTTPLSSVLSNDLLNHVGVVSSDITLTPGTSPLPGKITMNSINGTIEVAAGTPAGTYIYTYRICEVLNPTNCDNAIATIVVSASPIQAKEDSYGPINGKIGTTNPLPSVLDNDLLNGVKVVPADVKLTPGTRPHPGIVMASNGTITVAPGTPAGNYVYPYTICEVLNPTNCAQTVANINVVAAPIEAMDDAFLGQSLNGMTGGKTTSVLGNDRLNNGVVVPSQVMLTPGVSSHTGITMNADGTITVAPGTPAGTYTHAYRICEVLNPTNCDDAVATVRVLEAVIKANNDDFKASNGASGNQNVGNALTNDKLNGLPATLDKVTIAVVTPATAIGNAPVPVLDPHTGIVSVPEGTPAGEYKIVYRICEILNSTNCSLATITVTVDKATIIARPETYGPIATVDGHPNLGNVLHNDELNREQASLDKVSLNVTATAKGAKPGNPNLIVPVLDPATGIVSVPVGTPADTYTIKYTICEVLNPSNCSDTEVTVIVTPSQINAVNDVYESVLGLHANTVGNALDNDSFNNKGGLSAFKDGKIKFTNVTLAAPQPGAPAAYAANVPVLNTATGVVTIPAMTPAGKYVIGYEICEVADPTNCDQASITVLVTAAEIVAKEDFAVNISSVSGKSNAVNVIDNDKLNNVYTNVDQVSILVKTAAESLPNAVNTNVPVLNTATGQISVPAKTPAGEYKIFYEICELLNPTNCDRATAYIQVALPKIDAVNDTFEPVNSTVGNTTLGNVLINDRYNESVTAVTLNEVSLKVVQPARSVPNATNSLVPFIEANGNINVPATTPEGTYQIQYEICDLINPTNCDKAIATIKVFASLVEAIDDHFGPTIGMDGSNSVGNILTNDRFNSQTAGSATTDNVRIEVMVPAVSNHNAVNTNVPVLDPNTGNVSVPKGTPAGSYQIVYRICDLINLTHCDQAVVNIDVRVAPIDAVDDQFTPINGYDGGKTASVLYSNDKLNNKSITATNQSDIIFTPDVDGPYPGKLTMNADGTVTVAPQTKAGVYRWWYTICEALNPENCDRAVATITVLAAPIDAVEDQFTMQIDRSGAVTPSVLDNDLLNGLPVINTEIKLTPGVPSHPGLSMNPDGSINVQPGMKVGTYTYPYTICELLNPTNCDQAIATIVITAEDLFIPNAITPNGDGKNDYFEIIGWEAYERVELVVFNRWGNEVFRNDSYDNRWNGSGLSDGTYYYIVKFFNGNNEVQRQGWVLINGGR